MTRYNKGVINAELFKHKTRDSVIEYLSKLDMTRDEKNKFFKYWQQIRDKK